jgi:hypothetical protein
VIGWGLDSRICYKGTLELVRVELDAGLLEEHLKLRNYDMMRWAQA